MNICIIIDRLDIGGAERVAMSLANNLLQNAHRITIITIDNIVKIEVDSRIQLYTLHFEKRMFKYLYNQKKMYAFLNQVQKETGTFDLILVHLYKSSRIMQHYPHPCCYHIVHSTQSKSALKDKQGFARWRARQKIKSVYDNQNLICVSDGVKNDLLSVINIKPKTIQTIYNPFNFDEIKNESEQNCTLPTEEDYFAFVGRLVKEKRADYLLEAYAKSKIPQHLLIIGDGEEMVALRELSILLGIQDKIHFIGAVSNPYPYIKKARTLVLCSLYEGLPTVLIEALILQTPVISTNCPSGPKEILIHYTLDALVEDNFDNNKLTQKLIQYSTQTPSVSADCMATFSSEIIAQQYLNLVPIRHKYI